MSNKPHIKLKDISKTTIAKVRRGPSSPLQSDHSHIYYEIFYVIGGQCRFLLKDMVYHLKKGDFVYIIPGELHHAIFDEGECDLLTCYFKESYIDHQLFERWLPMKLPQNFTSFMGSIPSLYQEDFYSLTNQMIAEFSGIDRFSDTFLACHLQEMVLFMTRHSVLSHEAPSMINASDADILAATKYIYQNFRLPLSLDEVAAIASLSPTYFSKKFKQVTGMGFKEYLNYVRLKHAQTALLTTSNTITDIALEYGFNDSNYFKDLFKKVYGKSPREYRKNPL
ncbi:MAG: helix-turn-helix transcriptional regulator [Lachnospiraceae bacterium]|nr:helix-turn-helix transcriptional regulator [Lachnospiraceae bacterium]